MTKRQIVRIGKVVRLRRSHLLVAAICCLAALLRISILDQGLFADEIFSLAMATGHSLEHPAARAEPALGDFVEFPQPVPAATYRRYMEHEQPPAGPGRVVRAVLLSYGSNPPLYYLLLNPWTRWAGTSDRALRLFSVLWSIACIPVLTSLARRLGGCQAVLPACLLFACAPQSVYYSTEGRMYSMVWFLVLATAWLTLRLHQRGARPGLILLWVCSSAAGLLTHLFFAFVWITFCLWLFVHPHRLNRRYLMLSIALTGLSILPSYVLLPQGESAWYVTKGWLGRTWGEFDPLMAQFKLIWSYFTVTGQGIGISIQFTARGYRYAARADTLLMVVLAVAFAAALWRAGRQAVGQRWQMLWLWVAAANLGLLIFDLWQGTYTRQVPRYAMAGLPAAFLLVAAGLARLPVMARAFVMVAIVTLWAPGLWGIYKTESRQPFLEIGKALSRNTDASDVVIVHSIPSGVLGVARYLNSPAAMASWVGQLGNRRVPEDVMALTAGRRLVFLVKIHHLNQPAPEEEYLRSHAAVIRDTGGRGAQVIVFAPHEVMSWPSH